ncbi:DNA-binding protein [Rhizobium binxianense]
MSGKIIKDEMSEEELIESTEAGEWETIGKRDERSRLWQQAARQLIEGKRKRISISITERDLARLKAKAIEEGMPYQTLINSILHKYVS